MSSWNTNLWSNFYDPQWKLICCNKWHPGTLEISTLAEIAVGTHFHVQHGTKTTPVLLPADGEGSWLLISSSLKPGGKLSFFRRTESTKNSDIKKKSNTERTMNIKQRLIPSKKPYLKNLFESQKLGFSVFYQGST